MKMAVGGRKAVLPVYDCMREQTHGRFKENSRGRFEEYD